VTEAKSRLPRSTRSRPVVIRVRGDRAPVGTATGPGRESFRRAIPTNLGDRLDGVVFGPHPPEKIPEPRTAVRGPHKRNSRTSRTM
jgi:hypothetical protein